MKHKRSPRTAWALVVAAAVLIAVVLALASAAPAQAAGHWVAGDLHSHTWLTDGKNTETEVLRNAVTASPQGFGLKYFANSEPGGTSTADPTGTKFAAPVWRWLTLSMYSFPIMQQARQDYPGDLFIQGLEWNAPTHEQASVGIVGAANEPRGIADFEYMFDQADADTSRANESIPAVLDTTQPTPYPTIIPAEPMDKENTTAQNTVDAVTWLEDNYPDQSYCFINHPSRKLLWSVGDFRAMQDAAPDVVCGFEGFPGDQAAQARGGYGNWFDSAGQPVNAGDPTIDQAVTDTARTYGGADSMTAEVGGLWDSLLGEGRHWFVYNNSDYHWWTTQYKDASGVVYGAAYQDYWPGQYNKTWTYTRAMNNGALVHAIKSGDSFIVNGDLINGLDLRASAGASSRTMGQTLTIAKGQKVTFTIGIKSPSMNNNGDKVKVDHVDLITGNVTGLIDPSSPDYSTKNTNPSAHVAKTFKKSDMHTIVGIKGWKFMTVAFKPTADMYVRLRGTDLAPDTPNETDAQGNPKPDYLTYVDQPNPSQDPNNPPTPAPSPWPQIVHINTSDQAWADLWFYSNPIFVHVK